ncbi:UEV domain-containing protein [Phakopsora pachyrhizi]|uniref:UEV domain-domain-containing protein n=1 Tax=Phakopsora pachyrhizi TaxID=170000 RepID=A0AAV0BGT2_PHAPC|nr:UEV domain-containing protein [Phakopsora pachyrhizi]CAH7685996.1 UEV domain-domain-containing protein [Phakopsora pachyrhizi]
MPNDSVRSWLRSVLSPYPQKNQAFLQIDQTLVSYPGLSPKTDSFTFDDGRTTLLICLSGTIPVEYRGSSYNIPIEIWIPHEFPIEQPVLFVTPTKDMIIRRGSHVEPGGRCIGGYLDSWREKSQACSLNHLLEYLQDVFSREPPLYAKPKLPPPVPLYSPQLTSSGPSTSRVQLSATSQSAPPPRPPLPDLESRSGPSTTQDSHPLRPQPPARPPPPPPPPPIYSKSNSTTTQPPSNLTTIQSTANQAALFAAPNHGLINQASSNPGMISRSLSSGAYILNPNSAVAIQSQTELGLVQQREHQQIIDQHRSNQNLLDELDDGPDQSVPNTMTIVPPPRPPNPTLIALREAVYRKIKEEIEALNQRLRFEKDQLIVLQHDLLKGEPAIMDEMARLQAVRDVCKGVGDRYDDLVEKLNERISDLKENRKVVPVEELVCSTTVLYNQLWELITDDLAIDDTIYQLARALNNSDPQQSADQAIDLDRFLKRIRALGREQFLKRCMINKILKSL